MKLFEQRASRAVLLRSENTTMNGWIPLLVAALERKRKIDKANLTAMNMVTYDRWLVDAVELLLQIELERRGNPK